MSIFYEEEIGGDYDQDKEIFTNPNQEENTSSDDLYDEFNKLGDSYIKIREFTSIFHDEVITEKKVEKAPKDEKLKDKIKDKLPFKRKDKKEKPEKEPKEEVKESFSFLDNIDMI